MKESPVKIDVLLEPLLTEVNEEKADELLSQLITNHAEPVIHSPGPISCALARMRC